MSFLDKIAPRRAVFKTKPGGLAGGQAAADLRLRVGPMILPYSIEPQHILAVGATGAGKSVVFHRLAAIIRQRPQDRLVILDPEGALYRCLGRDQDTTANLFDARAPLWDPVQEIRGEEDVDFFALAVFPRGHGEAEEWYSYGRSILKAILERSPRALPSKLYHRLFLSSREELREIVKGTPAQRLFEPGAERMLSGTLGVLGSHLEWLRYLRDPDRGKPAFTFSNWARNAPPGARLFLPYSARQRSALIPFYRTVTTLIIQELISLPPVPQPVSAGTYRRTWLIADEFGLLGRVGSIEDALSNGRRFGVAVAAGFQDIHQLRASYGRDLTGSLLNNFGSWLVMMMNDGESAEYFSHALGNIQIKRRLSSSSQGHSGDSSSSNSTSSEQVQIEPVVLAGELLHLPNLEGFLRVRGDPVLHHISLPPFSWTGPGREWFIPRAKAPLPPPPAGGGTGPAPPAGGGGPAPGSAPAVVLPGPGPGPVSLDPDAILKGETDDGEEKDEDKDGGLEK